MIVIVHGYDGSEPGHWQRWLHDELRAAGADVVFPDLPAPTAPEKDAWVAALAGVAAEARTPLTFVCHSLGCWAVDHWLAGVEAPRVHAALLVAPPSPLLPFEPGRELPAAAAPARRVGAVRRPHARRRQRRRRVRERGRDHRDRARPRERAPYHPGRRPHQRRVRLRSVAVRLEWLSDIGAR